MKIKWIYEEEKPKLLKAFLQDKGVSRKVLAKVKFKGGSLLVNDEPVRVRKVLSLGDTVTMVLPIEEENSYLIPSEGELDILFEDAHYLIVNKPVGVYSVPAPAHRLDTMANRVKGYIQRQEYPHRTVHVVTRLDRDTSGVMIFAKHGYAHSQLDKLLKNQTLEKFYTAIVNGRIQRDKGLIDLPISRKEGSIVERKVGSAEEGKQSLTEFWVEERFPNATEVKVQLHTGRTHQIRVHFSYHGHSLIGDELYGDKEGHLNRQALHCSECVFVHPITNEVLRIKAPLPEDLSELLERLRSVKIGTKKTD